MWYSGIAVLDFLGIFIQRHTSLFLTALITTLYYMGCGFELLKLWSKAKQNINPRDPQELKHIPLGGYKLGATSRFYWAIRVNIVFNSKR